MLHSADISAGSSWTSRPLPQDTVLHWVGDDWLQEDLCKPEFARDPAQLDSLLSDLRSRPGHFAFVLSSKEYLLAAVDTVRSYPLFYSHRDGQLHVGNDARTVAGRAGLSDWDPVAISECTLSGYSMGRRTLLQGLGQLPAGHLLYWRHGDREPQVIRYYRYYPSGYTSADAAGQLRRLGDVLEDVFDRVITKAGGREIWVPLSGGLDSRLILAKLAERSYPALKSFSYGMKANPEAAIAKKVADTLGVDWRFVEIDVSQARTFFSSQQRRDYWAYSDGLSSVPNNQDILPLSILKRQNAMPADAVIVNGQSGDFISGAHIPPALQIGSLKLRDVVSALLKKHCSLWTSYSTPEHLAPVTSAILDELGVGTEMDMEVSRDTAAALYEFWEYGERQSKYVIHGQRSYDFLGHDWCLPLWDLQLIEFFRNLPVAEKYDQALYRRYLEAWNYKNLFAITRQSMPPYGTHLAPFLTPITIAARFVVGRARRDRLVRYLDYIGRFGYLYASYPYKTFARLRSEIRNPTSLFVRSWLRELGAVSDQHFPD